MAKLSAHGTELVRLRKDLPADDLITSGYSELAVMEDRYILKKRTVRFHGESRNHNYGWKIYGRLKKTADPFRWADNVASKPKPNGQPWRITNRAPLAYRAYLEQKERDQKESLFSETA
jgi:hypothetical protein